MYLLPCPECQQTTSVSPSQAGDETKCQSCNAVIGIPKLGVLRNLPQTDEAMQKGDAEPGSSNGGTNIGVAALGLLTLICLFIAGFAAIRWALIDVSDDTESHIAQILDEYETLDPARLIREYEHMETASLDMPAMFTYKAKELEKRGWGIRAMIAGLICLLSGIGTIAVASSRRTT